MLKSLNQIKYNNFDWVEIDSLYLSKYFLLLFLYSVFTNLMIENILYTRNL